MGGRQLKALLAQGRSGWANGTIASRDRKVFLFDNYLIGCPVPGSSFAGRTCEAFSRVDNSMAKELLDKCLDGIPGNSVFCHAELRMVARWLIDNRREGATVPSGSHEYVCMAESKPGILKDHYGLFANIEKKQISAKDWRPYMSLLAVDAFFRHIRNSIAHGSFTEVRRKREIAVRKSRSSICKTLMRNIKFLLGCIYLTRGLSELRMMLAGLQRGINEQSLRQYSSINKNAGGTAPGYFDSLPLRNAI